MCKMHANKGTNRGVFGAILHFPMIYNYGQVVIAVTYIAYGGIKMAKEYIKFRIVILRRDKSEGGTTEQNNIANRIVKVYEKLTIVTSRYYSPELAVTTAHIKNDRDITYLYMSRLENAEAYNQRINILPGIYSSFSTLFTGCYGSSASTNLIVEEFFIGGVFSAAHLKSRDVKLVRKIVYNLKGYLEKIKSRYYINVSCLEAPDSEDNQKILPMFNDFESDIDTIDSSAIALIKKDSVKQLNNITLVKLSLHRGVPSVFKAGKTTVAIVLPDSFYERVVVPFFEEFGVVFDAEILTDEVTRGVFQAIALYSHKEPLSPDQK